VYEQHRVAGTVQYELDVSAVNGGALHVSSGSH
jgi:hypothetical protein